MVCYVLVMTPVIFALLQHWESIFHFGSVVDVVFTTQPLEAISPT